MKSLGRYELIEEIGVGSTATVYRARSLSQSTGSNQGTGSDPGRDEEVAIKVLHANLAQDPMVRERFRREVLAARTLVHPGIVAVYDYLEAEGESAIVMEYCPGGSLSGYRAGDAEALRGLARELALALGYAHERGVVHRDLKPENVLLDSGGRRKLCDFGSARVQDMAGLTSSTVFIGTPLYVPPESVMRRGPDPRWDLYSLGALLYRCATGEPHAEEGMAGLFSDRKRPTHPCDLAPWIDRPLGDLILSLLGPPEARPRTAEHFLRLLEPGAAMPETVAECLRCGEPMPAAAFVCPSCLREEPDLSARTGDDSYALILKKLPEDADTLRGFRRSMRVLSGDPGYEPFFTTEDRRWYSKEERKRFTTLPCRLLDGISQAAARDLAFILQGKAKHKVQAYPKAMKGIKWWVKTGPVISPAARFTRPRGTEPLKAVGFERLALEKIQGDRGAARSAGDLSPEITSALPPGWEGSDLASQARRGYERALEAGSDSESLGRRLLSAMEAAAELRRRVADIDLELAGISPGALYAQAQRIEELISRAESLSDTEELIAQKLKIDDIHERCKALEVERARLSRRLLSAAAELDAAAGLPPGSDPEASLEAVEAILALKG
jgi:serine/threonine protein kinase